LPEWSDSTGLPFGLDETAEEPHRLTDGSLHALLQSPGCAALVLKPTLVGGVEATARLAALAAAHGGKSVTLTAAFESGVAHAHLSLLCHALAGRRGIAGRESSSGGGGGGQRGEECLDDGGGGDGQRREEGVESGGDGGGEGQVERAGGDTTGGDGNGERVQKEPGRGDANAITRHAAQSDGGAAAAATAHGLATYERLAGDVLVPSFRSLVVNDLVDLSGAALALNATADAEWAHAERERFLRS
jgi:hypothetical protein